MSLILNKAERTKQFIIERTAPIFNKKGYAGTSLSDLMGATGLTKGSIYGNFKNKDEVALEAFKYNYRQVIALFSTQIQEETSAVEKLLVYPRVYRKNFHEIFERGGCPILNTAIDSDDTHESLKHAANQAIISWRNSIAGIIKQGIDSGEIKKTVSPDGTAAMIISLVEGCGFLSKTTGDDSFFTQSLDYLEEFIRGLQAEIDH